MLFLILEHLIIQEPLVFFGSHQITTKVQQDDSSYETRLTHSLSFGLHYELRNLVVTKSNPYLAFSSTHAIRTFSAYKTMLA